MVADATRARRFPPPWSLAATLTRRWLRCDWYCSWNGCRACPQRATPSHARYIGFHRDPFRNRRGDVRPSFFWNAAM